MKLSNQAIGALMMALQKCIMEQIDIVEILQDFELDTNADNQIVVSNSPLISAPTTTDLKEQASAFADETNSTVGSD